MTEQTISLINISKSFDGVKVLSNVTAELKQSTAVMGSSGKGKTTLARIIMGLTGADEGEVRFKAPPVFSCVFQEDRLFEDYSAVDNVSAVCEKKLGKRAAKELAVKLLSEMLIEESELEKPVRSFSGGMKRRVALARALAKESDILVLDEAFKGLDAHTRQVCAECILRYSSKRLIIMITHDKTEAEICQITSYLDLDEL